jgi:hypothetical protein
MASQPQAALRARQLALQSLAATLLFRVTKIPYHFTTGAAFVRGELRAAMDLYESGMKGVGGDCSVQEREISLILESLMEFERELGEILREGLEREKEIGGGGGVVVGGRAANKAYWENLKVRVRGREG